MNRKLILSLLSSSSIFISLMSTLAVIHPAHAAPTQKLIHIKGETCIDSPHAANKLVCIRDSQRKVPSSTPTPSSTVTTGKAAQNIASVEFTEEESDAAIQLFGCDCPACVNSLRQLRGTGNLVY